MQVKVFESEDMARALIEVKQALGPDALILSTRTIRKKGLGAFAKPLVQVTAAVDPDFRDPIGEEISNIRSTKREGGARRSVADLSPGAPNPMEVRRGEEDHGGRLPREGGEEILSVKRELAEIKGMLRGMKMDGAGAIRTSSPHRNIYASPSHGDPLTMHLQSLGLAPRAVETISGHVRDSISMAEMEDPARLRAALAGTLADLLPIAEPATTRDNRQRKVALVGPTGVGKTTTIAKLAADCLMQGKRAALVTIDTYRIAAVEQLKIYGEIMNLPVEVVLSPDQFSDALASCAQADLVLIDTAGRSPRDFSQLEELEGFLRSDPEVESCLVLAAPTRESEMEETVSRFRRLDPRSIVFTKLDECRQYGSIFNLATRCDLPLSYLTDGQRVPEDLRSAEASFLADLILNENDGAPC